MKLRDYQQDIVNRIRMEYMQHNAPVVVLPCGGGKSCIIAHIAAAATTKKNRVLTLVHRIELCEQLKNTYTEWGVDMKLCDIGMVQTLSRRLGKLPDYDFIITDENHHAPCTTYKKIYEFYPKAKRLGVTATPCRLDGTGLIDTNDSIIVGVGAKWLISNKYLAPYKYFAPRIQADFTAVKIDKGDYDTNETAKIMDKPKIYGDIISEYKRLANGKQTIIYCCNVAHSVNTAAEFNNAGIKTAHVDGTTPKDERKRIFDAFKNGKITALTNCNLFSEGIDITGCECCLLLRPTLSLTLYIQSAMRCMRYAPGKTAIIIDCVGNVFKHDLPDAEREWSLTATKKTKRTEAVQDVLARQCRQCLKVYSGTSPICPYCGADNGRTKKQIEQDEKAELERIEAVHKREKRKEVGMAKTKSELMRIAKERNYKIGWVWQQMKIKNIRE